MRHSRAKVPAQLLITLNALRPAFSSQYRLLRDLDGSLAIKSRAHIGRELLARITHLPSRGHPSLNVALVTEDGGLRSDLIARFQQLCLKHPAVVLEIA